MAENEETPPPARWAWLRPCRRRRTYLVVGAAGPTLGDLIYTTDYGRITPQHIEQVRAIFAERMRDVTDALLKPTVIICGVTEIGPYRNN